jgi:hypothetical protein
MKKTTSHKRWFPPFLRAALALYLLGTVCVAEVHQHHGALQNHDCALCTIAHSPATVVPAGPHDAAPAAMGYLLPAPDDRGWDSESRSTLRSRAPPLA